MVVLCRCRRCGVVRFRRCHSLLLVLLRSVIYRVLLRCQALVDSMLCCGSRRHLLLLLLTFNLGWRALEFVTDSILVGGHCASSRLMAMMLISILLIYLLLITTVGKISDTRLLVKPWSRSTASRSSVMHSLILRSSHLFQSN